MIEKYTEVKSYRGKYDQILEVMKYITTENYKDMSVRIEKLNQQDCEIGSTNFIKFIKLFESDNDSWIKSINKSIE